MRAWDPDPINGHRFAPAVPLLEIDQLLICTLPRFHQQVAVADSIAYE